MFQWEQFQFKNFKILISIFLKGPDFLNHKMFIRMKNMPFQVLRKSRGSWTEVKFLILFHCALTLRAVARRVLRTIPILRLDMIFAWLRKLHTTERRCSLLISLFFPWGRVIFTLVLIGFKHDAFDVIQMWANAQPLFWPSQPQLKWLGISPLDITQHRKREGKCAGWMTSCKDDIPAKAYAESVHSDKAFTFIPISPLLEKLKFTSTVYE